jgi:hypothetical protein
MAISPIGRMSDAFAAFSVDDFAASDASLSLISLTASLSAAGL